MNQALVIEGPNERDISTMLIFREIKHQFTFYYFLINNNARIRVHMSEITTPFYYQISALLALLHVHFLEVKKKWGSLLLLFILGSAQEISGNGNAIICNCINKN